MDVVKLSIPADFVAAHARLTWREVQYGIETQLLDPSTPVELAVRQLGHEDESSPELLELASLGPNDPFGDELKALAATEPVLDAEHAREKLLYLSLAWVYDNRASFDDPLQLVEMIYADFEYPADVATFVRYMPSDTPDLGSREANEQRLVDRWKAYLDDTSSRLRDLAG